MTSKNAIECSQVSKRYSNFYLDHIDLAVPTGSVMGFVGPNGAGKSTTLRIIMGLVHQDSGDVNVLGNPMPRQQIAAKRAIGFVSEDMRLYPGQTLAFHINFMRSLFPTWDDKYTATLLHRFDLVPDQKVKGLSHGQRVKACLLLALARRPKLLVFDEPTTGLDPVARQELLEEMAAVIAEEDRTILFSSHNTQDVEQMADEITFIEAGTILFSKDKETMLDEWRRIRLQVADGFNIEDVPGLVSVQHNGKMAVLITDQYCPNFEARLNRDGLTISAVERLTLEEIFLASVKASKEQRQ